MGNRADDEGTDVEIYVRPLTDTVHADTPTGAPERLLALLDSLGFERKVLTTAGPVYVWHEVPAELTEHEKKQLATRAVPSLLMAGYLVNISNDVWDAAAYRDAASVLRRQRTSTSATSVSEPPATTASIGIHDRPASTRRR
ncbi:hypothetical protein AB0L75_28365 [Streptomyces sp. NPDC052101]|uniref:hypothetical protein n=1 Tax=Streptomyces sp. NPDC052101 TaxID=3155763 RepID=UPI003429D5C1